MSQAPDSDSDASAPGWEAIDAALAACHPGQTPKHYGTVIKYALGGPDPLDGLSAYWCETPVPHWHIVSYGLSELYEKEQGGDPAVSGYGFELSLRLAANAADGQEPPLWAFNFLQNLARYVFDTGNVFRAGDHMDLNRPIALEQPDTLLRTIALVVDPGLPGLEGPFGRVDFLQVVGLAEDELLAVKQWATLKVLDAFAAHLPLWVTDLSRGSLMALPPVRQAVADGVQRDGSSTGCVFVDDLAFITKRNIEQPEKYVLALGASQVRELQAILPHRFSHGHSFGLLAGNQSVWFEPGPDCGIHQLEAEVKIQLTPAAVASLVADIRPEAGLYEIAGLPALTVQVRKTIVHNSDGSVSHEVG